MTIYRISFVNRHGISHCFEIDNLFDLRHYINNDGLKGLTIGKIVDDRIVYFVQYNGGRRERKLNVNIPLIK